MARILYETWDDEAVATIIKETPIISMFKMGLSRIWRSYCICM